MKFKDSESIRDMVENLEGSSDTEYDAGFNDACEQVLSLIDGEPEFEVGFVRRGKWILYKRRDGTYKCGETVCSVCSGVSPNSWYWRYCPHCGAKMMIDRRWFCEAD